MTTPRRGRGRPALFDSRARGRYLAALAAGTTKKDAAAAAGVAPKTARDARSDPAWRELDDAAYARGRDARRSKLAHGESRYTYLGCRCTICKKAASTARTERRNRAQEAPVLPISPSAGGSSQDFLLAEAS